MVRKLTEGDKRRGSMRALAADVPHIVKPALGKRGFVEGQLVAQWRAIVGSDLASRMLPEKLTFPQGTRCNGILRVRVESRFALEAQHREPQILERLNAFFGYPALARLSLIQGPLHAETSTGLRRPRALVSAERTALTQRVAGVADAKLRTALIRLGEALIGAAMGKTR